MTDNIVFQYFVKGGWIMWLILPVSLATISVVIERIVWWVIESRKRDDATLDQVYGLIEEGNVVDASTNARQSHDARLRVIYHGLNHYHASLEGALQVAAGIEIERAGRFLVVLDTIVTLAPLLGLLGTVTGLMRAFFRLGDAELSEQAITGGIAEALIATACGLSIAVIALIALNYFSARVAKFQFELQNAGTNTEVLLRTAAAAQEALLREPTAAAINHNHNGKDSHADRFTATA
jgi:biopolymer transport protein ExbB